MKPRKYLATDENKGVTDSDDINLSFNSISEIDADIRAKIKKEIKDDQNNIFIFYELANALLPVKKETPRKKEAPSQMLFKVASKPSADLGMWIKKYIEAPVDDLIENLAKRYRMKTPSDDERKIDINLLITKEIPAILNQAEANYPDKLVEELEKKERRDSDFMKKITKCRKACENCKNPELEKGRSFGAGARGAGS